MSATGWRTPAADTAPLGPPDWAFWAAVPFVLPQALRVRRATPRFAAAAGDTEGRVGDGPPLRVLLLGDSVVAGVGIATLDDALPGRTAQALAEAHGATVCWRALGRIGAHSGQVLMALARDAAPEPADLVVVSAGVNDVTGLRTRRAWHADLQALIAALRVRHAGARVVFLGVPPFEVFPALPSPLAAVLGRRARAFDAVLAALCAHSEDLVHLPLDVGRDPAAFAPDGFHPSSVSCARLAAAIAGASLR